LSWLKLKPTYACAAPPPPPNPNPHPSLLVVGPGYSATGVQGSRSARQLCEPGFYCDGSGISRPCPAGRYGDAAGLTNDSCSGTCTNGVLCPPQTTSAAGQPCPAGGYCIAGVALPCPSGTYNPSTGAGNVSQCLLCPAGTFNAGTGASSVVECSPCPDREGSNPGATSCWPGILGAYHCVEHCRLSSVAQLVPNLVASHSRQWLALLVCEASLACMTEPGGVWVV
jgi:hypothetical protein